MRTDLSDKAYEYVAKNGRYSKDGTKKYYIRYPANASLAYFTNDTFKLTKYVYNRMLNDWKLCEKTII